MKNMTQTSAPVTVEQIAASRDAWEKARNASGYSHMAQWAMVHGRKLLEDAEAATSNATAGDGRHRWSRMDRPRECRDCGFEDHDGSGIGLLPCSHQPRPSESVREAVRMKLLLASRKVEHDTLVWALTDDELANFADAALSALPIAGLVEALTEFFWAVDEMTCRWTGSDVLSSIYPSRSDDCDDDEEQDAWDRFTAAHRGAAAALASFGETGND